MTIILPVCDYRKQTSFPVDYNLHKYNPQPILGVSEEFLSKCKQTMSPFLPSLDCALFTDQARAGLGFGT